MLGRLSSISRDSAHTSQVILIVVPVPPKATRCDKCLEHVARDSGHGVVELVDRKTRDPG